MVDPRLGAKLAAPMIFVGLVIMIMTVTIVLFGQNKYFTDEKLENVYRGDQFLISKMTNDYSTTWCSSYLVNPWDDADVYLLSEMPDIDPNKYQVTNINIMNSMMAKNVYDAKGAYLMEGSEIAFSVCRIVDTEVEAEVLIIKGLKKWKKWTLNQYGCPDCAMITKNIDFNILCDNSKTNQGKQQILNFTALSTDFYHITISRKHERDEPQSVYLTYDIVLSRKIYEIKNVVRVCNHTSSDCTLSFDHDSNQQILVDFTTYNSLGGDTFYQHQCNPFIGLWVAVFGLVPLSLIISAVIYMVVILNKHQRGNAAPLVKKW